MPWWTWPLNRIAEAWDRADARLANFYANLYGDEDDA